MIPCCTLYQPISYSCVLYCILYSDSLLMMLSEMVTYILFCIFSSVMFSFPFVCMSKHYRIFLSWIVLVIKKPLPSPSSTPKTFPFVHFLFSSVICHICYHYLFFFFFLIYSPSSSHFPSAGVSGQPRLWEHPVTSPECRQHQLSCGHDNLTHHPESQVGECTIKEQNK